MWRKNQRLDALVLSNGTQSSILNATSYRTFGKSRPSLGII